MRWWCRLENFIFTSLSPDAAVKLIDFGLSKKYSSGVRHMVTVVGTAHYMAPEVKLSPWMIPSLVYGCVD